MTKNKVTIVKDELGNAIRVSKNNATYGHVRLSYTTVAHGLNNWVKAVTLSTLIHGTVEDLIEMGFETMNELPGKIVAREQLEPFGNDSSEDLKIAGETGIVCMRYDEPIYRKTFYTTDENEQSVLIQHTNIDEIRAANGAPARVKFTAATMAQFTSSPEDAFELERTPVAVVESVEETEEEEEFTNEESFDPEMLSEETSFDDLEDDEEIVSVEEDVHSFEL